MKVARSFKYPEIKETDYRFAGVLDPREILRPDGDWRNYVPPAEDQRRNGIESSSCYVQAQQHTIATILDEKYDLPDQNFSERFNFIFSGGTPNGGDPLKAAQSFRDYGLIPDALLPFSTDIQTWDEFNSFKGSHKDVCVSEGKDWRSKFDPRYEIVITREMDVETKYKLLKQALKYSPVPVSVANGYEMGLPKSKGQRDIHLVELIYIDSENRPVVWDTYAPYQKTLAPLYNFEFGMRWAITKNETSQITLMEKLLVLLKQLVPFLQSHPDAKPTDEVPEVPQETKAPEVKVSPYLWDTKEHSRHSARVVMDEYGLTPNEKDLLCATIEAESGWKTNRVCINLEDGTSISTTLEKLEQVSKGLKIASIDYGIIQANTRWYIGVGKPLITIDEAINNPEKCVRVMINSYRRGRLSDWIAYRSGAYKKYL